ncbi:hypothetical protein L1887_17911 [Cichorium endivia]|nr:hypothetical protein L1887_17911 [Cichorium endivia]
MVRRFGLELDGDALSSETETMKALESNHTLALGRHSLHPSFSSQFTAIHTRLSLNFLYFISRFQSVIFKYR